MVLTIYLHTLLWLWLTISILPTADHQARSFFLSCCWGPVTIVPVSKQPDSTGWTNVCAPVLQFVLMGNAVPECLHFATDSPHMLLRLPVGLTDRLWMLLLSLFIKCVIFLVRQTRTIFVDSTLFQGPSFFINWKYLVCQRRELLVVGWESISPTGWLFKSAPRLCSFLCVFYVNQQSTNLFLKSFTLACWRNSHI